MKRRLSLPLSAVLLVVGCGSAGILPPGNDETDRIARVVSDAIAWPRQESSMGYARAAAATTAGQDGRLTVVEVTELEAERLTDPLGELTFLVQLEGSTAGWVETDPVTACYRVELGFYGVVGSPRRTRCPDDATPVEIPALPPASPRAEIPDGADRVLRAELRRLPSAPEAAQLEAALVAALTNDVPAGQQPEVGAVVDGRDVGVSVRGGDECLLGARADGRVEVWRPSSVQLQPGELTCDPETALAGWGQDVPH
ncbi:MAG TPA: hypothetical protein VFZ64_05735 [Nocardioidaceae bacterium]